VTYQPTDRQLDILAAWWYAKGSSTRAAAILGDIGAQPVRNALYLMRKVERADSNLDLALRFMDQIERRKRALVGRKVA
jgi:hypothetical protein